MVSIKTYFPTINSLMRTISATSEPAKRQACAISISQ
jgi:hypothetical protein